MVEDAGVPPPPPDPGLAPAKTGSANGSVERLVGCSKRSAASGVSARASSVAAFHCVPSLKRTASTGGAPARAGRPRARRLAQDRQPVGAPDEPQHDVVTVADDDDIGRRNAAREPQR